MPAGAKRSKGVGMAGKNPQKGKGKCLVRRCRKRGIAVRRDGEIYRVV